MLLATGSALWLSASMAGPFGRAGAAVRVERRDEGVHRVDGVVAGGGQRVARAANRLGRQRLSAAGISRMLDDAAEADDRHRHRRAVSRGETAVSAPPVPLVTLGTADDPDHNDRHTTERQSTSPGELPHVPARVGTPSDEHGSRRYRVAIADRRGRTKFAPGMS